MEKMIEISNGITLPGFLATPEKEGKYPGIILIFEIWGLTDHMKDVARRLANEGYVVLLPDLFANTKLENAVTPDLFAEMRDPTKRDEAQKKMRAVLAPMHSPEFATDMMHKLELSYSYLKKNEACNGTIGTVGFCFGGTYSFALSAVEPEIKASVPFYGQPPTEEQIEKITCPTLAFYGEQDENLISTLPKLEDEMKRHNKGFDSVIYPNTGHAFFNDTNKSRYNKEAATDAWKRTLTFLSENLK